MRTCIDPYTPDTLHTHPMPFVRTDPPRYNTPTNTPHAQKRYPFDFATVDKPYETYTGLNVRLRYFLRVTVTTKTAYVPNIVAEQDLLVQTTTEVARRGMHVVGCCGCCCGC